MRQGKFSVENSAKADMPSIPKRLNVLERLDCSHTDAKRNGGPPLLFNP
jgi:hypothetical protein